MDTPHRPARDRLKLLRDIAQEPHAYGFYHVARLVECAHPHLPRLGTSRRLRDDPIRFGQDVALDFAAATVAALEMPEGAAAPRLRVRFNGLMGPNGPLPLHLTEFARDRQRNHADSTLVHFLDTFQHRLFSMFYRAWADAQPTVSLDRPGQDPFGDRLAALGGYGSPALQNRDTVPEFSKRAHTGLLANSVRNAEGLARIVANFFRVPAKVEQWQPHWLKLPPDAYTRIGLGRENAQLGATAVLGGRIWDCQNRFRIVVGPLTLAQYMRFLPDESSLGRLRDWVRNYIGDELSCELQLLLRRTEVPATRLGQAGKLGWTSWLGRRPPPTHPDDADDLVLQVL